MTITTPNNQPGSVNAATAPSTTSPPAGVSANVGGDYTFGQLEALLAANGAPANWIPTMAAIAADESGGSASAENPSGATGLFQIMWPLHEGIVPCATSQAALEDPNCNAQAAVALLGGGAGFCSGWGSSEGGDKVGIALCGGSSSAQPAPYSFSQAVAWANGLGMDVSDAVDLSNMNQAVLTGWVSDAKQWAKDILGNTSIVGNAATGGSVGSDILGIPAAIGTFFSDLISPAWWKRIGVGALGAVLVIGGIILFVSTTDEGKRIEQTATEAGTAAVMT